ncbi:MAG TPA: hypothetical protein VKB08_22380 [Bradyrhizobium sp.]|nr:hypothetical protein [Bradyrhizobium sp.]
MLDLNEQAEIGEVLALRRQLDGAFDSRRIILQVLAGWRLQIAFYPELQPRQHAILDLIAISLVVIETAFRFVEGGLAEMLEFQLAKLDNRRTDFEVVGMRLRRDREKQQRRCHKSLAPHEFPFLRVRLIRRLTSKFFAKLQSAIPLDWRAHAALGGAD